MFGDILLLVLGSVLMILGILGCFLPVIPGPPLSFLGLLSVHYTEYAQFSSKFLLFWLFLAIFVTVIDYFVPVWGNKKFGGSKRGVWGSTIGLVVGIVFFPPIGIILGPFLGALIFELSNKTEFDKAFKASLGSLFGFLMGVGMKLIASFMMTYHFVNGLL